MGEVYKFMTVGQLAVGLNSSGKDKTINAKLIPDVHLQCKRLKCSIRISIFIIGPLDTVKYRKQEDIHI